MRIIWGDLIITLLMVGLLLAFVILLLVGLFRIVKHTIRSEKTLKRIEEKLDCTIKEDSGKI